MRLTNAPFKLLINMQLTYAHTYTLLAGATDYTGHLPLAKLIADIIETATEHANALHIGYADLLPRGIGWVLSRITLHMDRWPGINSRYTLTTYVEAMTRLYSVRCMDITDGDGNQIGSVRTVWVCIDFATRTAANLTPLHLDGLVHPTLRCALPRAPKLRPVTADMANLSATKRFEYCDLDFNGHVNSTRYVEPIVDLWGPEHYADLAVADFDIAYLHECRYGDTVTVAALTEPAEPSENSEFSENSENSESSENSENSECSECSESSENSENTTPPAPSAMTARVSLLHGDRAVANAAIGLVRRHSASPIAAAPTL